MLFYILFLLVTTGLLLYGFFYPKHNNFIQPIVLIIVIFIAGFRLNVGADFDNYVEWYVHKTRDDNLEFGFVAIMNLFRLLDLSPHFLFFFFSFLTYFFFYLGVKKFTVNANLAFIIFLLLPGLFLNSMTFIRQAFSMTIAFYAFYFLLQKKNLLYILLMLIGISIHNSCFLPFIVFYFVYKFADKIKTNYLYLLLAFSFILSQINWIQFLGSFFENTRYTYYFSTTLRPVSLLKLIVLNSVAVFVLFYASKMKETYIYQKYFLILFIMSVLVTNIFASKVDLTRLSYYFKMFEIIVIADLIVLGSRKRRNSLLFCFYIYYFTAFMYSVKYDAQVVKIGTKFTPYNNVFFEFKE